MYLAILLGVCPQAKTFVLGNGEHFGNVQNI